MNRKHMILVPPPIMRDAAECSRYFSWMADCGITGLFLNGSTGEFTTLTDTEKVDVVRVANKNVGTRMLLIAGAIEGSVSLTLEATARYAKAGAHAIAICPPPYFRHSQQYIIDFMFQVADKSALPVYLYDIPAFTTAMSYETIDSLSVHPNIIGLKDSSRDFARFERLIGCIKARRPEFRIFTGSEELLLAALFMGADGATVATGGIEPEKIMNIVKAFEQGDFETARKIQFELLPLIAQYFSKEFPIGFKEAVLSKGFAVK